MVSQQFDWTYKINNQGQATIDVGEWDRVSATVVAPIVATLYVYGTNDGGAVRGQTNGNARLATNFKPVQVTDLSTGTAVSSITGAGNYSYAVNTKYLRFQGGGVSVYKLITDHMKID